MKNPINKTNDPLERIKIGLLIGLLVTLAGCAEYWGGGYYYGETVMVSEPEPDIFLFGGSYDRRRDAHNYSHRGSESRRVAHSSTVQSHGAAYPSGEQRGKR